MAKLVIADRFVDELSQVCSDDVLDSIRKTLEHVADFPKMGSPDIPASIVEEFGSGIRKLVAAPFDIFYEYNEHADTVYVLTLVYFRLAR